MSAQQTSDLDVAGLFQTVMAQAPIGIAVLDGHGRYLLVNEAAADIAGLTPQDHVGRSIHEVVPGLTAAMEASMGTVLATGEPVVDDELSGCTAASPDLRQTWRVHWLPVHLPDGLRLDAAGVLEEVDALAALDLATAELEGRHGATSSEPGGPADGVVALFVNVTEQRRIDAVRRLQALELNDGVLQRVAAAKLALQLGEEDLAIASLDAAIDTTRSIMSRLLERPDEGFAPGDFVRSTPSGDDPAVQLAGD